MAGLSKSPLKKKKLFLTFVIITLSFATLFFFKKNSREKFLFLAVDCSLYSRAGVVLFQAPADAIFCAFHDNGSVLLSNPVTGHFWMIDQLNRTLWHSEEVAHHVVNFSNDQKQILAITSQVVAYKSKKVRSDCFSVRDLLNKKIHEWCAADHLAELTELGFDMSRLWEIEGKNNNHYKNENVRKELSHANSFYEIGPNTRAATDPAFTPGNYILHLYGESRPLLILDSSMKRILWHLNMSEFTLDGEPLEIDSHALQVTSRGTLLAYFSVVQKKFVPSAGNQHQAAVKESMHSRLIEFLPDSKTVVWQYSRKPLQNFLSPVFGWVHELDDKSLYFNDNEYVYQIKRNGQVEWSFKNPVFHNEIQMPKKIVATRFFKNTGFLDARGINLKSLSQ